MDFSIRGPCIGPHAISIRSSSYTADAGRCGKTMTKHGVSPSASGDLGIVGLLESQTMKALSVGARHRIFGAILFAFACTFGWIVARLWHDGGRLGPVLMLEGISHSWRYFAVAIPLQLLVGAIVFPLWIARSRAATEVR